MDLTTFDNVLKNLDDMTASAKKIEKGYRAGEITPELIRDARALHGKMDKVMQNEVYHLIGMGGLTIGQNTIFSIKIKELGKYRQVVKTVASLPENPSRVPSISTSVYNSILTETTLKGGE